MLLSREPFDPVTGFQYYVNFRPYAENITGTYQRLPVEAAVSVAETGDLADVTFTVPKRCRNEEALTYIQQQESARYIMPRVFLDFPGISGDAVLRASGFLDLDPAGRIIGMELRWRPRGI